MKSNLYSYNSRLLPLLYKTVLPDYDYQDGYAPLYGEMESNEDLSERSFTDNLDAECQQIFEDIIKRCKENGVQIAFTLTPHYTFGEYDNTLQYKTMKQIILDNNCIFVEDLYHDPELMKPQLFKDSGHPNHNGAILYTQKLVSRIKAQL